MNNLLPIIQREFKARIISRPFIIMTALMPALLYIISSFAANSTVSPEFATTQTTLSAHEVMIQNSFYAILFIYIFLSQYAIMMMQSVIQEKKNRLAEVLLTIVAPHKLLGGKMIAIALTGIIQMMIWLFAYLYLANEYVGLPYDLSPLSTFFILFLLYFIGGYILYASLLAMIGSSVGDNSDVQQFVLPVTLVLLLSFFAGVTAQSDPHSLWAQICTYIPFSSSIVTIARYPFGIAWHEIWVSLAILYATAIFTLTLASYVYRHTILRYSVPFREQLSHLFSERKKNIP